MTRSYLESGLNAYIGQGLNATSNPDPNTLGVVSPYVTPYDATTFTGLNKASAAWLAQVAGGKGRCIVPKYAGAVIPIWNKNSAGAGASTTIDMFLLNRLLPAWAQPLTDYQVILGHNKMDHIVAAGVEPIFFKLAPSSGTCDLITDDSTCWIL